MSEYILIVIWSGLAALLSQIFQVDTEMPVMGRRVRRVRLWFAVLVFLPLVYMAANRGELADTYLYLKLYEQMPDTWAEIPAYLRMVNKDQGFSLLSCVIHVLVGNQEVIYLGIIALLQTAVLVQIFRKYSINYVMSFFLFVASADYVSWMLNGMRQFCAVVLIFAATPYILKKKWTPTVLLILLASTMHMSALLMLPVVFLMQGRAWNKRSLLFLGLVLLVVTFVDQFTDLLDEIMRDTQYASMVADWETWDDDGTNVIRVLVYAVPTILSLVGLRYIRHADDPVINLCANMSIVSTGLYIISMVTSGIFIGRLPIYASLYNYILLPWLLDHMFTRDTAKLMKWVMVAAYLGYYYYQMHIAWAFI